jgi:sulfur-oxidizing protein SoxY
MRLAKSQDVIAIAAMSDGSFLIGTRAVSVKIGGCGI